VPSNSCSPIISTSSVPEGSSIRNVLISSVVIVSSELGSSPSASMMNGSSTPSITVSKKSLSNVTIKIPGNFVTSTLMRLLLH